MGTGEETGSTNGWAIVTKAGGGKGDSGVRYGKKGRSEMESWEGYQGGEIEMDKSEIGDGMVGRSLWRRGKELGNQRIAEMYARRNGEGRMLGIITWHWRIPCLYGWVAGHPSDNVLRCSFSLCVVSLLSVEGAEDRKIGIRRGV